MATISKPFTFSAGATIIASEHNSNNDTIYNEVNGQLSNVNIDASAAIAATKLNLATIAQDITFTGTLDFSGATMSAQATFANLVATTANIDGGTIDDTAIGVTSQSTGHFTSLQLATGATITGIADEDDMSSDSATLAVTQQSTKAYVDSEGGGSKLLSTTSGSGTNTGDITIAADKSYVAVIYLDPGANTPVITFAFNSDTTGTDYRYMSKLTDLASTPTETLTGNASSASVPFGTSDNAQPFIGRLDIHTYDDVAAVDATFHLKGTMDDTGVGGPVDIEVNGRYSGGAVTSFELQFSQSTTYVVRLYERKQ